LLRQLNLRMMSMRARIRDLEQENFNLKAKLAEQDKTERLEGQDQVKNSS